MHRKRQVSVVLCCLAIYLNFSLSGLRAAALVTDDHLHPLVDVECRRLCAIEGGCRAPIFAIDSNSLLATRKPVALSQITGAAVGDWLSADIFELLFDEALRITYADEAVEKFRKQWEQCSLSRASGVLQDEFRADQWIKCLQRQAQGFGAEPPLSVQWSALRDALGSSLDTESPTVPIGNRVYSVDRWSARGCSERLRSTNWIASPSQWAAEAFEAHSMGLLSPLQMVDALHGLIEAGGKEQGQQAHHSHVLLRESLRRAEYARYVCLYHNQPFLGPTASLRLGVAVPWFDLLPSNVVSRLRTFSVSTVNSARVIYPHTLHTAKTPNEMFNTIQKALVCDGRLPIAGDQMLFWLMFLMASLPSFEVAISTAYVELCTYCRVRIDTTDSDCSYTTCISFLHGIIEFVEVFQAAMTTMVESKLSYVLILNPILSELERKIGNKCASDLPFV